MELFPLLLTTSFLFFSYPKICIHPLNLPQALRGGVMREDLLDEDEEGGLLDPDRMAAFWHQLVDKPFKGIPFLDYLEAGFTGAQKIIMSGSGFISGGPSSGGGSPRPGSEAGAGAGGGAGGWAGKGNKGSSRLQHYSVRRGYYDDDGGDEGPNGGFSTPTGAPVRASASAGALMGSGAGDGTNGAAAAAAGGQGAEAEGDGTPLATPPAGVVPAGFPAGNGAAGGGHS
jgi:hypothetical protein